MRITRICLLGLIFLWSLPVGVTAQPSGGVIRGRVSNGTSGGGTVEGLEVVLRSFQDQTEAEKRSTIVDSGGVFVFEGLETEGWSFLPHVLYADVVYSKGLLSFESGQTEINPEIAVFDTTNDAGEMGAERAHLFMTTKGGALAITEFYVLSNPGDRTYVGSEELDGRRWTSRFNLPKGARDVSFDDGSLGGRFLATKDGFVDAEPLWPGRTNVLFSYTVDCPGDECDLSRRTAYPITDLNVLLPATGVTLVSDRVVLEGEVQSQQGDQLNYAGHDIAAGEHIDLRVRLNGPVNATTTVPSSSRLPWFILGAVLGALALAYPFWRQRIRAEAIAATGTRVRDRRRTEAPGTQEER